MERYEVIESRLWRRDDGATASIYGALPWRSEAEKARWTMQVTGWTVRDNKTSTVGLGRAPFKTREEAEAVARRLGCPGMTEYGRGFNTTKVHGACCAKGE